MVCELEGRAGEFGAGDLGSGGHCSWREFMDGDLEVAGIFRDVNLALANWVVGDIARGMNSWVVIWAAAGVVHESNSWVVIREVAGRHP